MAQSTQRAVSDGSLALLDLSIDYLSRSEITVYFDAVLTTAWAWVGETEKRITFTPNVPAGVEVLVKRSTDISKLRHEFSKGAAFTAEVLDEDLKQVLHIAQEASEANLSGQFYSDIDMHNYRVRNIGTAVDDTDALTLGQYKADADGAFASKTAAAASATAAANSATAAAGSATTAGTRATNAGNSATAAANSATNAGNSATAAANSASAAATSATNAASASRLTVGTVTTGAPGSAAAVSIAGAAGSQTVSFTIPRGDVGATGQQGATGPQGQQGIQGPKGDTGDTGATGPANTLAIGTVTTGAAGSSAAATITGTSPNQTLNLTIPRGIQGPQGPQGETGPQGPAGTGSGDVLGPGTATVDNELVLWNGTTGTSIKRAAFSGLVKTASGVASAAVAGTDYVVPSGSITGNAATATALKTARTINGTSFNGSANITTSMWGTASTLTIGGTGKSVDGSAAVSWSLAEIGAQPVDADLTAIAALAGTSGLLRKTAADTWSLDTSAYITGNQTITFTGDATGSGTTAVTLTLANSGATAGTYRSVTVDAKGRVTAGTNPTTLAGYGITDAATSAQASALLDVPSNAQTVAYTLALSDRGKSIDTTAGVTIPANSAVAFPVGAVVVVTNVSASNISIGINTDTLRLAGTANTGTRTLSQYGVCTLRKVASTTWIATGAGLT